MTRPLYALIGLALLLSLGHHADHVLRGATGWPLAPEFTPFTYSLVVYPLIAAGLLLSLLGRAGPRFWFLLSTGGALFVLAVHLGPAADDRVARISAAYPSSAAGALALAELALFVVTLVGLSAYEGRLLRRRTVARRWGGSPGDDLAGEHRRTPGAVDSALP